MSSSAFQQTIFFRIKLSSTIFGLRFMSFEMDHMNWLKMRKKYCWQILVFKFTYLMTTIFTQNDNFFHPQPLWLKTVIIFSQINFPKVHRTVTWDKSRDPSNNLKNYRPNLDHLKHCNLWIWFISFIIKQAVSSRYGKIPNLVWARSREIS